jgi:epoxyqueuosine reductase
LEQLQNIGFKAQSISLKHISELEAEFIRFRADQIFDETFYQDYLSGYLRFALPEEIPSAQYLIVVASPQPALKASFSLDGRILETIIPPTYVYNTDGIAVEALKKILHPQGYRIARAKLPNKALAVRCGLAFYGKNNISYVEGMGSYFRLAVFYTDAPLADDNWGEPRMLKRCENCVACIKKCPTEAIPTDRFIIHQEKCLTYLNESESPFPAWVDPAWQNCLVGCMICQNICPENKPFVKNIIPSVEFTEAETALILSNPLKESLPESAVEKLKKINLYHDFHIVPRNLKMLVGNWLNEKKD